MGGTLVDQPLMFFNMKNHRSPTRISFLKKTWIMMLILFKKSMVWRVAYIPFPPTPAPPPSPPNGSTWDRSPSQRPAAPNSALWHFPRSVARTSRLRATIGAAAHKAERNAKGPWWFLSFTKQKGAGWVGSGNVSGLTPQKTNIFLLKSRAWKTILSLWNGPFLGDMLVFWSCFCWRGVKRVSSFAFSMG